MIKVLLADNDLEILKNLNSYIKSSYHEFKVAGLVNDSSSELTNIIKSKDPDVIIADIRFFGISGFRKIKELNERFPDLRYILYGSYSDTDYINKASEYGVIDHLYRPIKHVDLNRCLENAINYFKKFEELKKREIAIVEAYNEDKILFENIFLISLIHGQIKNELEIFYSFKYFNFELKPSFTVIIVHIDHFKKVILTMDEMEKHVLCYNILEIINNNLSDRKFKAFIEKFNSIAVVLSGDYELDSLVECFEEIKSEIFSKTGVRVTVGIGRTYEKATDISVSYREAKGAILYRFHIGYNSVIHITFVEPVNNITYRYPLEREERLVRAVAIGEYEYAVKLLKEIFDALHEASPLPYQYLPKVIMNILISINKNLSEQNIDIQNQFSYFFPSKHVFELGDDIEEAFNYLKDAMKRFCEHIVSFRKEQDKTLINGAKNYLQKHFYESLSLSKVATELGTTPEYINKLFVAEELKNVFDYTVSLRIKEAKKLLKENQLEDDMIAVKVGYDDVRHFRSVFKKHENMSTKEYRMLK